MLSMAIRRYPKSCKRQPTYSAGRPFIVYNMKIDLGLIDYEDAYKTQKELVAKRKLCEVGDTLILAEHNAVFTIGRSGGKENLLEDEKRLEGRGIKVLYVDRGGDITFHG